MVPGSMRWIRKWVYRWGFRPKAGSILYSPTLSWTYSMRDNNPFKEFGK